MSFREAARLGGCLSRDYAPGFFRILVNYPDISASEAASRLGIHIRTAQDFLETLSDLGILESFEVNEGKRPYFRYTLAKKEIVLSLDLHEHSLTQSEGNLRKRVKEAVGNGARFTTSRSSDFISAITISEGQGRDGQDRRLTLTQAQGRFLYNLPYPTASPISIGEIIEIASIDRSRLAEITDLIELLERHGVIDLCEAEIDLEATTADRLKVTGD